MIHFWLHRTAYRSQALNVSPDSDSRVSITLYRHSIYTPSMPGGYLCTTEIVYDNSNDERLISETESGRAAIRRIDKNFYLRYPPCG